ncbi:MAG: hypothetical protein IJ529_06245 [Alphaproteobacteria bacterium]|nr:hypothetical protein [Alphaproteobacteria bacterium]
MSASNIISSVELAYWFIGKSATDNLTLSHSRLQNLLFLSQLHYALENKTLLTPALFVRSASGFYEAGIKTLFHQGHILGNKVDIPSDINTFLEEIWRKYSSLDADALTRHVTALSCWKNLSESAGKNFVNILDIVAQNPPSSPAASSSRAKIRLSQHGPVEVSPWQPRKLRSSSSKKDN